MHFILLKTCGRLGYGWDESPAKVEPTSRDNSLDLNKIKTQQRTEPPMKFDSPPWNNPSPAKEVRPSELEGMSVF